MVPLQEQVGSSIAHRRLFAAKQPILVAVSGGVDSMVLLDILAELTRDQGWKLTVAHLNHQLRGASSAADERLVRRRARELDLPIVVSRADVRGFSKSTGLSIEMAARKLRHDFLAISACKRGIRSIALAHHLDDQIELFFLRLFRGSGSQGLAGMKWTSPSPSNPAVCLVRPLLDHPKKALMEYAAERQIRFREDSTNNCLDIQRNRIRNELLPLLAKEYQPALQRTIARFMNILGAESELVNTLAESCLLEWGVGSGECGMGPDRPLPFADLGRCAFEELPVAIQRCCLQIQLVRQGIAPDYELIEHLRLNPGRRIEVANQRISRGSFVFGREWTDQGDVSGLRIARDPGGVVAERPCDQGPFRQGAYELDLREGKGQANWEGVRFAWQIGEAKGVKRPGKAAGKELFDADMVGPCVILRHWRPGDRFQPIGMDRAVKLQDLFVNQKVPRIERRQLAVAATGHGEVFWVEGLRVSERFKLTRSTIRRLHWAWQRL